MDAGTDHGVPERAAHGQARVPSAGAITRAGLLGVTRHPGDHPLSSRVLLQSQGGEQMDSAPGLHSRRRVLPGLC